MERKELDKVLEEHGKWTRSEGGMRANLCGANLCGADLRRADLCGAELRGADLCEADLPSFQICEGRLIGWKKINIHLIKLAIPIKAKRTASLVGRKCRAEYAKVLEIDGGEAQRVVGGWDTNFVYDVGKTIKPDSYDDDIRVECTHGIHFFQTREEAEDY